MSHFTESCAVEHSRSQTAEHCSVNVLSSVQTFAMQAQAAVEKRAEELDKQAEALTQEKQKMSAVGIADNDVLDLNVGGVSLSVKRATLTQVSC